MTSSIQLKRDTTAGWVSSNRVLLDGEVGVEETPAGSRLTKIGNGATPWLSLPYHRAEIWAPGPSGGDDTAALNAACSVGSVRFPAGSYTVNGTLTLPIDRNHTGAGSGKTVFNVGSTGQVVVADPASTSAYSGQTSGFTVNGNGSNNQAHGALFINAGNNRTYTDIQARNSVGDCAHIEQTQNNTFHDCVFQNSTSGTPLVFDHGTGGNRFWGGEIGEGTVYGSVLFQQTYADSVGYGSVLGPSDNKFYGTIMEYASTSSLAQVGHLAGTDNGFYGSSQIGYSTTGPVVLVKHGCQLVTTTATITAGQNTITVVGSTANIVANLFVNAPGFNADVQVISVAGQVVTLNGVAASSHAAGTPVGFGGYSTDLIFTDATLIGSGSIPLISTCGSATVSLSGKTTLQTGSYGFSIYASDTINISGPVLQQGVTHWAQQNSADTGTANIGSQIGATWQGTQSVVAEASPYIAYQSARAGDTYQRFVVQDGAIFLGNGTIPLGGAALLYAQDARDGTYLIESYGEFLAKTLRVPGLAGATTQARFFGIFGAAGAPLSGTWLTGDFIIDLNGATFVCTAGGTPGTWVGPNQAPTWTNLTPISGLTVISQPRYSIDSFGFVHLDGVLEATASIAANTALFTAPLPVGFRPTSSNSQAFNVYAPSNLFTAVSPAGVISVGYGLSAGVFATLNGLNYPTN
jgi:hypothetical protein